MSDPLMLIRSAFPRMPGPPPDPGQKFLSSLGGLLRGATRYPRAMLSALGILAWLLSTLRLLGRYPHIPAAAAERRSLWLARLGLGGLDIGLALGLSVILILCPPLLEIIPSYGCPGPPMELVLDLYSWGLRGWRALWLVPLLGGLRWAHRPLLDQLGWRRGWVLLPGALLGGVIAALVPLALLGPFHELGLRGMITLFWG